MTNARERLRRLWSIYVDFAERQGFMIILTVCVATIAGTALWTKNTMQSPPEPTSPAYDASYAAQLQQQSLRNVSTPVPLPSPSLPPDVWHGPLASISVLTEFQAARLTPSAANGLWRLHDAVDLRCTPGEPVCAMKDGSVSAVQQEGLLGGMVEIDHGQGIIIRYAGMSAVADLRPGDPVDAGQTIGFAGNGVLDETDLGTHLHLRVTRNGTAMDPLDLLQEAIQ